MPTKEQTKAVLDELNKKLAANQDITVEDALRLLDKPDATALSARARGKVLAGQTCDSFC